MCVCVSHPKVTFHQTVICHVILLSVPETLESDGAGVRLCVCGNVRMCVCVCKRCESAAPQIMPGVCRRVTASCCLGCTRQHTHTHARTLFPLPPNLSCPELLSAIHFPVSQPSITPARPQMQPSLLKMKRGSNVYTRRRGLRQAKREGGLFN